MLLSISACGMSEAAQRQLAADVEARNGARVRAAEDELARQGYLLVKDEAARVATLDDASRERCLGNLGYTLPDGGAPAANVPLAHMRVKESSIASAPSIEVTAPLPAACEFFRARRDELDVTKPDGTNGRLVRLAAPRMLARSRSGEVVRVEPKPRVVAKHKVRVDRKCDRMALEELEPLRRSADLMVMWASAELRTVEMPFDREELDVECAKNLY